MGQWQLQRTVCAAKSGDVDQVRELLQQGKYHVNCTDRLGHTALLYAACYGHLAVVEVLIAEFGADQHKLGVDGVTALIAAASQGYCNIVEFILSSSESTLNIRDKRGNSVLHHACITGSIDLIRTLVHKYKGDVNARNNDKDTPLHVAAHHGNAEAALMLIREFNCDPTLTGQKEMSLLHSACAGGNANLVKALISEYNADIYAQNDYGWIPLHVAASSGQAEVALMLIRDFDCAPIGYFGESLLHIACQGGCDSLVKALICDYKAGGHVQHVSPLDTDFGGNTALHLAAKHDKLECTQALVEANAPILIKNHKGRTVIDVAQGTSKVFLNDYMKKNLTFDYTTALDHAKKKYSGTHHITRLFVLGYPGAGKST